MTAAAHTSPPPRLLRRDLYSKEGTRELEMNPKAACRLCGVVFTRDKYKRRKVNDAALHGFHRRWSHPSMDAERARSKGGRYEDGQLVSARASEEVPSSGDVVTDA